MWFIAFYKLHIFAKEHWYTRHRRKYTEAVQSCDCGYNSCVVMFA